MGHVNRNIERERKANRSKDLKERKSVEDGEKNMIL